MNESPSSLVTRLLAEAEANPEPVLAELVTVLYPELRRLARSLLSRRPPGQTLQPTALVHEAYLRLVGKETKWQNRAHFFGAAARAMRDILVEQARRKAAQKRGGGAKREDLRDEEVTIEPPSEDLLALDEALSRMERNDPQNGRIVMLRYFAGLTEEETAELLGVSRATITRKWRFIRHWLYKEIAGRGEGRA